MLLVGGGTAPADLSAQTEAPSTPRDERFGVVEAFWSPEQAATLGPGWERILFYWSEIQPEGPEDWNTLHVLEEWLHEANAQGRQVMGLLKHTPAWATDGPVYGGVPRGLYLPLDDPNNLWANYVRRIAAYYGPLGVHHWIIWNEPDIAAGEYGNEWAGSEADYARLLKVAYLVMKETDPQAQIHLAGLTFWHDEVAGREQYLDRLLREITADPDAAQHNAFFDYLSLHIYFRVETVPWIVQRMDEIQNSYGLDKPIWINETNAAPTLDPLWPVERPEFPVDLEQQAWYLVQAHALAFAAGVESIGVYKFSDVLVAPGEETFGLLRADFSERPAFQAHRTLIERLSGFTEVWQQENEDYWLVGFDRPPDTVRILWARNPVAVTVELPVESETAVLVSAMGEEEPAVVEDGRVRLTLPGARCYEECIIGGPPVFLVTQRPEPEEPPATIPAVAEPTRATPTAIIPPAAPTPIATSPATPLPTATAVPVVEPAGEVSRFSPLWLLPALLVLGGVGWVVYGRLHK